ncbi:MAG: hypothetical protein KAQ64_02790 [Candidatus Pacebacteria bacterium]|nr:hypothetical protein [Candidatus Paceibacterota bacterium]
MKKSRIFPIICFLLLLGAILLATYFKGLEKKLEKEQDQIQNESSTVDQIE